MRIADQAVDRRQKIVRRNVYSVGESAKVDIGVVGRAGDDIRRVDRIAASDSDVSRRIAEGGVKIIAGTDIGDIKRSVGVDIEKRPFAIRRRIAASGAVGGRCADVDLDKRVAAGPAKYIGQRACRILKC